MPKRLEITLSQQQRAELLQARDHHSKAYVREKAAAILKIADERLPALQVASHRLLKRRDDNTVRSWLRRYLQGGLAGLLVQKGRGKKPAFSPSGRPKHRQCPRDAQRDKQRDDKMVGVISREEESQEREKRSQKRERSRVHYSGTFFKSMGREAHGEAQKKRALLHECLERGSSQF